MLELNLPRDAYHELTHVSAQRGLDAVGESEQGVMEFWIMALHITLVVYRAYRLVVFVRLTLLQPSSCWYLDG